MDAIAYFRSFLNKYIDMGDEEFSSLIEPHISLRKFKRKEVITPAGEVENYLNFIVQGLARKYFKNGDEELVTQISHEGHIIHSQGSFHRQRPSHYIVEAIEATTLVSISYDGLNAIFSANAKMERMGRLVITDIMVINDRWQMMLLKMTPRERFLDFVKRNPDLMERAPQKQLASLLDIQPETFSRFKHLIQPASEDGTGTEESKSGSVEE